MPAPGSPVSFTMRYRDGYLAVYPLVEPDEASGAPTSTDSYVCFLTRQKSEPTGPPGPPVGAPMMPARPRHPEWITIRVKIGDTSSFATVEEAFEAGKEFADLRVHGPV